jgi:hypothetical protein
MTPAGIPVRFIGELRGIERGREGLGYLGRTSTTRRFFWWFYSARRGPLHLLPARDGPDAAVISVPCPERESLRLTCQKACMDRNEELAVRQGHRWSSKAARRCASPSFWQLRARGENEDEDVLPRRKKWIGILDRFRLLGQAIGLTRWAFMLGYVW